MRARAPASSANLGPGFDTVAVALGLYVEVEITPTGPLRIETHGHGSDQPTDHSHLAARVARHVLGHDDVSIVVRSEIPLSKGLGSSAALAVAAAAAAGAEDPLAVAAGFDGHVENAAASFHGGLVVAGLVEGQPVARRVPLDGRLRFVAVVPDRSLATPLARSVLPATVALADAVHNLSRLALLLRGLEDADELLPEAGEDKLHQPYRTALFPESAGLLEALRQGGATVSCWSGAGPSLIGICTSEASAEGAADAAGLAMESLGVAGVVTLLRADHAGLVLDPPPS